MTAQAAATRRGPIGPDRVVQIARLGIRLQRFVAVSIAIVGVALAGLALWYAAQVGGHPDAVRCLRAYDPTCDAFMALLPQAGLVKVAIGILPFVGGLLLGVPVVAGELDRGTATLAWALEPSRWRWLAQRLAPLLVLVAVVGLVTGLAADRLEGALVPGTDPDASFRGYGTRGPLVAARFVLVLGIGVLVGALLGRLLPALLVALLAVGLVWQLGNLVHLQVQLGETIGVEAESAADGPGHLVLDLRYEIPSGERLTWPELEARYPDPADLEATFPELRQIVYLVPGERYPIVSGREAAAVAGLGLAAVGLAGVVVARRHPGPGRVRLRVPRAAVGRPRRTTGVARPRAAAPSHITRLRLIVWPHRVELLAAAGVGVAALAVGAAIVASLGSRPITPECLEEIVNSPWGASAACETAEAALRDASEWRGPYFVAMSVGPWLAGALAGVVVVGRELEQRTAVLVWALAPDRRRWLLPRVVVGAVLVAGLLAGPALLATEALRLTQPWVAPDASLAGWGSHGPLVVARGVLAFAVGVLAGAVVGRVIPALLAAGLASLGLVAVLAGLLPYGVPVSTAPPLTLAEYARPPELIAEVVGREAGLLMLGAVMLVVATAIVVERRRP